MINDQNKGVKRQYDKCRRVIKNQNPPSKQKQRIRFINGLNHISNRYKFFSALSDSLNGGEHLNYSPLLNFNNVTQGTTVHNNSSEL